MADRYWVGASGAIWYTSGSGTSSWSTTSGGSPGASYPISTDNVIFDQPGTYQVTVFYSGGDAAGIKCANLTVSAGTYTFKPYTGTNTFANINVFGSMSLASGTAFGGGGDLVKLNFVSTSTGNTISASGASLYTTTFNGVGGEWALSSAVTIVGTATLQNGTVDLNGKTLTLAGVSTSTGTKNLTFNGGSIVTTGFFANGFPTGFTTTAGTGTGTISLTSASAKTFTGGGSTYNCTVNQGGAGALTISGSNTFANITNTYSSTGATTVKLTGGTTTTFTNFNLSGASGNVCTFTSTDTSQAIVQKTGAWYMGANSTNGGNNSGLIFSAGGGIDYLSVSYIRNALSSGSGFFLLF